MNKKDIIEAIHFGIRSANVEHFQWTGGNWVTPYGVESYIASCIARSVMELKRFWSERKCLDDIERLCCLMRTLSRDKGGSLRGAIFALLVTVKPRNAEGAINVAKKLDKYEAIVADYLDKRWIDKGISSYSFSRGTAFDEPMVHEDGHLFSSLCVVLP